MRRRSLIAALLIGGASVTTLAVVGLGGRGPQDGSVPDPGRGTNRRVVSHPSEGRTVGQAGAGHHGIDDRQAARRYDVRGPEIQALLGGIGGLTDLAVTVTPLIADGAGLRYQISSLLGDGVLTEAGFVVTDPRLLAAAGFQPGDTIVRINGHPVRGFLLTLLAMRRDPDPSTVEVEVDRRGARIVQIYRVR